MTRKCKKDDKFVKYVKAGACEDGDGSKDKLQVGKL